jgi:DNA-binding MarR family transcriptional regulator/N-acetylglutamate synthase-like GNAT family acetyltransferase
MESPIDNEVDAVRRFNRFYTGRIGVLREGLLDSPFTLAQARVLFELGTREAPIAGDLVEALGIDPGYMSRIVRKLTAQDLVSQARSTEDGRRITLALTRRGRATFQALERDSRQAMRALLAPLSPPQRGHLLDSMAIVQQLLAPLPPEPASAPVTIRPSRIGDFGWAIERHGRVYADEYGWNGEFEALVATLFGRFGAAHDPATENCWIAERGGERVGCVFVVRNDAEPTTAQLRCLLVDPAARGLGVGARLVDQCLAFARAAGYARIMLWTNSVLVAARRLYEAAGFALIEETPHHSFGHDLIGQTWAREL